MEFAPTYELGGLWNWKFPFGGGFDEIYSRCVAEVDLDRPSTAQSNMGFLIMYSEREWNWHPQNAWCEEQTLRALKIGGG